MSKVWFGSINNRIMEMGIKGAPLPYVGMGATITSYTDRAPATVVEVQDKGKDKIVYLTGDKAYRVDKNGMSESQTYIYECQMESPHRSMFRAKFDGDKQLTPWQPCWINPKTNRIGKRDSGGLRLGEREKYHDFSF